MLRPVTVTAVAALGLATGVGCSAMSLDDLQRGSGGGTGEGGGAATTTAATTSSAGGASTSSTTSTGGDGGAGGGVVCAPGTGDCDGDGACEPLDADPGHCGACGHDCLGGDCLEGRCQPFVFWEGVAPEGDATGITLAGSAAFLCATGGVRRLEKSDGEELILDPAGSCTRITTAGPHAYYTRGGLKRVPLAGGDVEPLSSLTMVNGRGVAVDDTHAYAITAGYEAPYTRTLSRVTRDGAVEETTALEPDVWAVAVHETGVLVGGEGGIHRVDPETLAVDPDPLTTEDAGSSLVVVGDVVYFMGAGLWALDLISGEQTLLRPELSLGQVATDGEALYVTLFDVGTMWRVSFDGAQAELLADLGPGIDVPAIDDSAIYVTQYAEQRVYKLAR